MVKWNKLLQIILQKFIDTKEGKEDGRGGGAFWGDICRFQQNYVGEKETFVDGWITAFSVFDRNGNWQGKVEAGNSWPKIEIAKWASGIATVPLKIEVQEGFVSAEYDSVMFAGHMGKTIVGKEENAVQPYSGWAVALK